MAVCPMCGFQLYYRRKFPHIFKKEFVCNACNWKMDVDEVHKRGGMDRIATNIFKEGEKNRNKENSNKDWEQIERLPNWAFKEMKIKKRNLAKGRHYTYKREGVNFFRKLN